MLSFTEMISSVLFFSTGEPDGNHLHGEWLYVLVFVHFFHFLFTLFCVSLVCDTVKWFFAFVRHKNVECRVAFTASRGHKLLARFWSWRRNQCDSVYFAVLAWRRFRGTSTMFIVYIRQRHEHSG